MQQVDAPRARTGPRYELYSMTAAAAAHGLGVALVLLSELALRSPWGRMMRAIRDNEVAAEAMKAAGAKRALMLPVSAPFHSALMQPAAAVMAEALKDIDLTPDDIDWVVPHQANARILDATARKLSLPAERVVVTVDQHANTSAASVPLALDTAVRDGRIQPGHLVVLEAMGGGFTWGAAVLRY